MTNDIRLSDDNNRPCNNSKSLIYVSHNNNKVWVWAISSRVFIWLCMSTSCALWNTTYVQSFLKIPDDESVMKFDLRLLSSAREEPICYCLQGQSCCPSDGNNNFLFHHDDYESANVCLEQDIISRKNTNDHNNDYDIPCCTSSIDEMNDYSMTKSTAKATRRRNTISSFYNFLLLPLTRWDAARFLTLTVYPWHRRQRRPSSQSCNKNNKIMDGDDDDDDVSFLRSEQAHAFLPFITFVYQWVATRLQQLARRQHFLLLILPPTYEATCVLSAAIVNNFIAFPIAAVSIYQLTLSYTTQNIETALDVAWTFCFFNPATVFFTTAYSESIFSALTFTGYALWTKQEKQSHGYETIHNCYIAIHSWRRLLALLCWMAASYTRSNGILMAAFVALVQIGQALVTIKNHQKGTKGKNYERCFKTCSQVMIIVLVSIVMMYAIVYPFLHYDREGYKWHCSNGNRSKPSWCDSNDTGKMYSIIQRAHWNVGWFRYYQFKQIPNFILASPILTISISATFNWIQFSWTSYCQEHQHQMGVIRNENGCQTSNNDIQQKKNNPFSILIHVFNWALWALKQQHEELENTDKKQQNLTPIHEKGVSKLSLQINTNLRHHSLTTHPKFLAHYAILAGFFMLSAFLAHVQISTRLICSSCPAVYWLAASQKSTDGSSHNEKWRLAWKYYTILYAILGIIMHVNWLPWT